MKKIVLIFIIFILSLSVTGCKKEPDVVDNSVDFQEIYPNNGVWYEIFVRSFADSDGDGIGDFKGIQDKLQYLKDLGVDGLWLMPINPSDSYHGYDVLDYYDVNSDYGTMADFEQLLQTAHEMGIKIIMDLVINHTSSNHPWFKASYNDDPTYRDWYIWITSNDPRYDAARSLWHGSGTYYCGYFGSHMPELNLNNIDVRNEIYKIGEFWVNKGIDGFRIDAASHLYGYGEVPLQSETISASVDFLNFFEQKMKVMNPNIYVVTEAWTDYNTYSYFVEGVDSTFNFDASNEIVSAVGSNGSRNLAIDLNRIFNRLAFINPNYIDAIFLRNHDMDRVASIYSNDFDNMRLAAESYLFLPGNPFIYYGEELGMQGIKWDGSNNIWDETRRLPIPFGDSYDTSWIDPHFGGYNTALENADTQQTDPNSLYHIYQNLIAIRKGNIALMYGDFYPYTGTVSNDFYVQGYYRYFDYDASNQQLVLVLQNFGNSEEQIQTFDSFDVLYYSPGNDTFLNDGTIAPNSTLVIQLPYELKNTLIIGG